MVSETSEFALWLDMTASAMGFKNDAALAKALGINPSSISRWKSGMQPRVSHLAKVSEIFGVDLKPLLVISGHLEAKADGPGFTTELSIPDGLIFVSRDDLQSVLRPAAGQDPLQLTSAVLRLREACGLDDPDEGVEVDHGFNGYRRGCRCAECREGNRAYRSASRAKRIERSKEDPSLIPHGQSGYTNWNCRCKTCSWAGSVNNRKSRQRRKQKQGENQ